MHKIKTKESGRKKNYESSDKGLKLRKTSGKVM